MTQPLRYAINVTLDGCVHHEAGLPPDAESMACWTDELRRSDTLLYGRVTYELMEVRTSCPSTDIPVRSGRAAAADRYVAPSRFQAHARAYFGKNQRRAIVHVADVHGHRKQAALARNM